MLCTGSKHTISVTTLLLATSLTLLGATASGQGYVPVSVKFVHDQTPVPGGQFSTFQDLIDAVDQANAILAANGASWKLMCCEIVSLANSSEVAQFLDVNDGIVCSAPPTVDEFDLAAKQDPVTFGWRFDALNVYVVNSICGLGGALSAGSSLYPFPEEEFAGGDIVVLGNDNDTPQYIGGNVLLHEIGHHLSLSHYASPVAFHNFLCHCVGPDPIGSVPPCPDGYFGGCECSFSGTYNLMASAGLGLTSDADQVQIDPCQLDHMDVEFGIIPPPADGSVQPSRTHELRSTPSCVLQPPWRRADCDGDGSVTTHDVRLLLDFVYGQGNPAAMCMDACDANDDGVVDVSDAVFILGTLGAGGVFPAPFPQCGGDPTFDALTCTSYLGC